LLILAHTWFAFGLPSKTGCDRTLHLYGSTTHPITPLGGKHISTSPEGISGEVQVRARPRPNSQNLRTCLFNAYYTKTCLAEDAKVNKERYDNSLIYFQRLERCAGANTGHCFPTPITVSKTPSRTCDDWSRPRPREKTLPRPGSTSVDCPGRSALNAKNPPANLEMAMGTRDPIPDGYLLH
jgi:hypothetical protein